MQQNNTGAQTELLPQAGSEASWLSALKASWRAALSVDRTQITPGQALRSAIGCVLPLTVGVATGHIIEGVSISGGAALLGGVGLTYTYRARLRTLLISSLGIAISAFVGAATSRIDWLAILLIGVWGFGAGMLAAISTSAMIVGVQACIALIILTHFALDPVHAALQALLLLIGALFQVVLAFIPLPWIRTAPERRALAAALHSIADYVLTPKEHGQQANAALLKAQSTLLDSNLQSQQGKIFFGLLEEAEHLRLSLLILTQLQRKLQKETSAQQEDDRYLNAIFAATAQELHEIADDVKRSHAHSLAHDDDHKGLSLRGMRTSDDRDLSRAASTADQRIKQALADLRVSVALPQEEVALRQQIVLYASALRNNLHRARKLARAWRYPRQRPPLILHAPERAQRQLQHTGEILRANLTMQSAAFRHAIRLAVVLSISTALYHAVPLLLARGYWIALTALLVLRPDFTTTFTRGGARLLGTMAGAVVTTLLLTLLVPTLPVLVVLYAIMVYLAFSLLFASYTLFSLFITTEVVILLTFVEPTPLVTTAYRAIDTAIGGALALLIYALWPTWEHHRLPDTLARRFEALGEYLQAVLQAYAMSDEDDALTIERYHMASRLARSNAEAAVKRSEQEPRQRNLDLARGLLAIADQLSRSVLTLEAYQFSRTRRVALPETTAFADQVAETLQHIATALRLGHPVEDLASDLSRLQKAVHTLEQARRTNTLATDDVREDRRIVLSEARRIDTTVRAILPLLATSSPSRS